MIEVKENNQIVTKKLSVQCTMYILRMYYCFYLQTPYHHTPIQKWNLHSQDWNKGFTIYHEIGIHAPPHQSVSMTKRSALCIV